MSLGRIHLTQANFKANFKVNIQVNFKVSFKVNLWVHLIHLRVVEVSPHTTLQLGPSPVARRLYNIRNLPGIFNTAVVRIFMGAACHPFLRKCDVSNLLVASGPERQQYEYPDQDDEMEYEAPAPSGSTAPAPAVQPRSGESNRKRGHEADRHRRH
jgi:hypothetical protein